MVVKTRSGGPATSYQQSGDWSLQDSSPADSRTGGLEDWYLSRLEDWKDLTLKTGQWPRSLVAPLSRGRRMTGSAQTQSGAGRCVTGRRRISLLGGELEGGNGGILHLIGGRRISILVAET